MELKKRRRADLIKFIDIHNIKGFRTKTKPQLIKMIMEKKEQFDFKKLPPVAKDRRAEEKATMARKMAREKKRIATRPARQAKKAQREKKKMALKELKEKTPEKN